MAEWVWVEILEPLQQNINHFIKVPEEICLFGGVLGCFETPMGAHRVNYMQHGLSGCG